MMRIRFRELQLEVSKEVPLRAAEMIEKENGVEAKHETTKKNKVPRQEKRKALQGRTCRVLIWPTGICLLRR